MVENPHNIGYSISNIFSSKIKYWLFGLTPLFDFKELDSDFVSSVNMNPFECKEAVSLLSFTFIENIIWGDSPKGCVKYSVYVYCNSHPTCNAGEYEAPLCLRGNCLKRFYT